MNAPSRKFMFALVAVLLAGAPWFDSAAAEPSKVDRLFERLENVPALTPASPQIYRLVKELIRLNPVRADAYFARGLSRIPQESANRIHASRLVKASSAMLVRSDLTKFQIKKILTSIQKRYIKWKYFPIHDVFPDLAP